mmetsp:Transcript_30634/g.81473  ORF Transcript_30634/g.81473 Transcript_30634/m.81473 type:complete len:165 (+) Transcript_30634:191-685(+)
MAARALAQITAMEGEEGEEATFVMGNVANPTKYNKYHHRIYAALEGLPRNDMARMAAASETDDGVFFLSEAKWIKFASALADIPKITRIAKNKSNRIVALGENQSIGSMRFGNDTSVEIAKLDKWYIQVDGPKRAPGGTERNQVYELTAPPQLLAKLVAEGNDL